MYAKLGSKEDLFDEECVSAYLYVIGKIIDGRITRSVWCSQRVLINFLTKIAVRNA